MQQHAEPSVSSIRRESISRRRRAPNRSYSARCQPSESSCGSSIRRGNRPAGVPRCSGSAPGRPAPAWPLPCTHRVQEGRNYLAPNAPEREDPWEPTAWHVQDQPDDDGRVVFYAPQGLKSAWVSLLPEDEATAFKQRIDPNGPILPMPPGAWATSQATASEPSSRIGADRAGLREDGRRCGSGGSLGHGPLQDRGAGLCKSIRPTAGRPLSQPEPYARS